MTHSESWIARENTVCAQNYAPLPVVLTRGEGVYLYDIDDKQYLDLMSAYSAVSMGHGHPRLVSALVSQAARLSVTSRAFHNDQLGPFLEKLTAFTGLDQVVPMNSGAEAVETAIKAARRYGYQVKGIPENQATILVATDNFHGRTLTVTSFSTEPSYQKGYGPFTPGFKACPFGDLAAFEAAMDEHVCAVLIEPMQGEAGVIIPPTGFLKGLQALCKKHQALLLIDEIQTGLGRTGKRFAYQHELTTPPDGLILGKALGGGLLPVSAFVARTEVMSVFNPGSHGSTFGGNALAARVAREALSIIEDEHLVTRSQVLGETLFKRLTDLQSQFDWIKAVRGKGLWCGFEVEEGVDAYALCVHLLDYGLLTKEAHSTVIRFAPPLTITEAELTYALDQLALGCASFASTHLQQKNA